MEKASNPIMTIVMPVVLALGTALSVRPAAADPGHQVQIEHRGLTLNGWLTEAEEPVATILMLHGTLAHANMEIMATFAEILSEENIETLRVTLSLDQDDREGMFDCSAPHRHKHGDAVDELAAWVRWLADNGRSQVVLLGHSRGTNQVARFAVTAEGEGMPMVLVAPSVYRPGGSGLSEEQAATLVKARDMVAAGRGDELMHGVDILHCTDADATANSFLSYYDDDPDYYTLRLAVAAHVPVLVILGSEDTINEGVEEALADLQDGSRISVLEVDGADHFFRDLYAYDVAEGVRAWLQEIAGQ
jgi:alpha/beta superfamily hydrolase